MSHLRGILGNLWVIKAEHAKEMVEHAATHLFHVAKEEIVFRYHDKPIQALFCKYRERTGLWAVGEYVV
jgi:hypothetical protein